MEYFNFKNDKYFYFIDSNRIVNGGVKDLFLEYASNKKIEWEDTPVDEDIIGSRVRHLKQIIFESTQDCTLRCRYCTYGGSYLHQRKNTAKYLSFDTARKTIDYIGGIISTRSKKELIIGFYGGEPLLNFDTIEQIVDYSKKLFPGWELRFTVTTNGTLLEDRIIHFLVKNNFSLMVSLDGSGKNHDAKRIFPDGRGSFDLIMENMKKIKDIDNDYYQDQVSYFVTYSKDLPVADVYRFFLTDERVNKNTVNFNYVNHLYTDYYNRYPYDASLVNTQMGEILRTISEKKIQGNPLAPVEEELLNQIIDLYKKTQKRRLSFLSGTCLFDNRLYVDADGVFHICEK
ncbi:MAG: radical SAM protein, partial [Candidatus Aminicenantes bacterium]|nr:radical SAM protein [Candidatus Aminicenantes bacterium]